MAPSKILLKPGITIEAGAVDGAVDVMREAAQWLLDRGTPLWPPEDITGEKLLQHNREDEFILLKVDHEAAGAMILTWWDPFFWPDAAPGESGYIHKLCVPGAWRGKGCSRLLIDYAIGECCRRKAGFLRLDCAADREKLGALYESMGFTRVGRRKMGPYDVAFYELPIT